MSCDSSRQEEDVIKMLHLAKLSEDDVTATSQLVYFTSDSLYENNFKLLQLTSDLLEEIKEGKTLYVKGKDNDKVVICSEKQTFHVSEAETSNSLLITRQLQFWDDVRPNTDKSIKKVEVCGIFYNYLEAVLGKPHLNRILELLEENVYRGPECEFEIDKNKLFSFEDLMLIVQSSKEELNNALDEMDVVTVDGMIRLLDFEYHFRVLSYMLKLIEENSWELDEIDYEETVNALGELVPRNILSTIFGKYAIETKVIDGLQLYRYNEEKVCKFFAQVLLHEAGRFNYKEFLQAWKDSVPEGMMPDEEMLYGIAVVDRNSNPNVIWSFNESSLPDNIVERFKVLFSTKEKWTVPEISPYIKRLATDKLDVNALLAKYARASKVDGVKYYSAKHGK